MGRLLLEVRGQVDDGDGLEGTLLDADTAADAKLLGDGGDLVVDRHLNAKLTHANDCKKRSGFQELCLGILPIIGL